MTKLTTNPPLYFDTDCLSAFLWIENESILTQLYPGRVMIPKQVYDELGSVPHLQDEMTGNPRPGHAVIGRGEAASLALSKTFNGIVASNNLRDITQYIEEYQLQHKTTGDILIEALDAGIITEQSGNSLWSNMLRRRRQLGAPSFTDFLRQKGR